MSAGWQWPGSRWWKFDFHAHTGGSHDFREDTDWVKWATAARDAGIHAIAVTDHNTAAGVTHIQEAASRVDNSPVVFPGVELTASDGSHLLLLMDPSSRQTHVEDLLSRVGIGVEQRGQMNSRSSLNVEQVLDETGDDALVIGAHVNGPDGLLGLSGEQRLSVLRHSGLSAVEVNPNENIDSTWLDGSKPEIGRRLSQVWSSDSHDFDRIGQRFTWVKMTEPNLEGLRLALLDGAASLKPRISGDTEDPNRYASTSIESIRVDGAMFIGRQQPITVCLNPWLNAIIGGRGTGKSTLVDFCRKTLRREDELDGTDSEEEGSLRSLFDRRMSVPESRSEAGLLTDDTLIEMVYRKDDQRFLLSWSRDGSAPSISRLDGDSRISEDGDIRERFPVRIYSQKQLFTMAQHPNALLNVIDNISEVGGAEIERRIRQMEAAYLSLRAEARAAWARARELPARRAALRDVQHKLDVLQQGGHAQILNTYRARRQTDETWNAILESTERALDSVRSSVEDLSVSDLDLGEDSEDDAARAALRRAHQYLSREMEEFRQVTIWCLSQVERRLDEIRAGAYAQEWVAGVEASAAEYERTSSRLASEGISDPSEYGALLGQAANLGAEIEALDSERERAEALEVEASATLALYREERIRLSDRRQTFADAASSNTLRVRVDAFAEHESLVSELSEILGIGRFERDREKIADNIRPEGDGQWDWNRLDGAVEMISRFHSGAVDSWESYDGRFKTALKGVPPERIDRLALYLPKDSIEIEHRDERSGSGWRSLSQGSPGQQNAALLAFVLGFGSEPVILDQPEDDLDNTLIYELLVERFREGKHNRQMIVVTHNPNIVVHGDAEFVISLDVRRGRTVVERQGGLQETGVRDEICRVMEGGREAFETRYRRIIPQGGRRL